MNWQFEQRVDLQQPTGIFSYPDQLMSQGDHLANVWRVVVYNGLKPADLTGYAITAFFNRSDGKTVPVNGTIDRHIASVVLPQSACTSIGPLIGILRANKDDQVITLATCRWNVRRGPGIAIVDSNGMMPTLDDLLEKIGDIERQTLGNIRSINNEMELLHPLSITSFSVSPSMAEKGSTISKETFSYSVNRMNASLALDGESVTGHASERTDILTADKAYTLTATLGDTRVTATAKITFVAPVYYGASESYALTNDTVLALTRVLTTTRARTVSVNAGAGQYILYALPTAMGTPAFKVGGFEGGFTHVGTFHFTNASGHAESYSLYRSVNAGLGSTTVTIS